ncbi:hypothetical protein [Kitasatospora sp. NPDC008115]|uniref:hypothetical protein n=1 Tax=Kitasatospora sp. NPDC008115 TaxID=3364022 RepID=UPI0036E4F650
MSEPPAPTLVEVTTVPQIQPPTAGPAVKTPPAPAPAPVGGAVPGVPLAVAVANALGGTVAGALSLSGPVALAVAGTAAGAAAIGGLARRSRTPRRHTPHTAARRAAAQRAAAPGGLFTPAPTSRARAGGVSSPSLSARSAPSGARSAGRAAAPAGAAAGRASAAPASSSVSRKGPSAMGRTAGTPSPARSATGPSGTAAGPRSKAGGPRHRAGGGAAHTLAKAASRLPGSAPHAGAGGGQVDRRAERRDRRLAKVAERTARRVAKGQARAERAAGIDPATGAGVHPAGPGVLRGSGPSPVQAKALRRSAARHRARMAGVAAATGLVGLASAAVGNWRHKGKVAGHVRRTWARMAARARAVRAARDAAILGTANPTGTHNTPVAGAVSVPVPAQYVNIPGRPTPTPAGTTATPNAGGIVAAEIFGRPSRPDTTPAVAPITLGQSTVKESTVSDLDGSTTAASFNLTSAADVLLQAATTFDPETMIEFGAFADDLPVAFTTLQDVLRVLAEQAAERLPLDPAVVEEISQGYRAMGAVVHALDEVAPTFRKAHAEDLERHENPRNGLDAERKWNV